MGRDAQNFGEGEGLKVVEGKWKSMSAESRYAYDALIGRLVS